MSDQNKNVARSVFRVVALQFTVAVLFSALVALFAGVGKGWSAAMGGAIAVLGSLGGAVVIARGSGDAKQAFRAQVIAEMLKVFVTAVLFICALVLFKSADWIWLILGFAAAAVGYWLSLLKI